MPNEFRFHDWKSTADNLKDGKCDKDAALFETEGEVHLFGDRIPKHCLGLVNVLGSEKGFENVMLLDIEDGLVYWMDCPRHILETCEPKPVFTGGRSRGGERQDPC